MDVTKRAPRNRGQLDERARNGAARATVLFAALATMFALLGLGAASSSATPTSPDAPAVNSAHPYSNPVWLPLHSGFGLDCAGNNPGCRSNRSFFSIDLVPTGQFGPDAHSSHAKVYAMGAGVVHIGEAHGTSCGSTSVASFGTWVWIDHGSGVVSRYGHLSKILVKNGAHVAAGSPIGVVGDTGKAKNCGVNYTDFMVEHHGLANNDSYHFNTLRTCSRDGAPQTWPAQAATMQGAGSSKRVHFTRWDKVHQGTVFPASTGDCLPGGVPSTTTGASAVRLASPAHESLTVSWAKPASRYTRHVMVELSVYHSSTHSWARAHNEVWRSVPAAVNRVTVSGLMHNHIYRTRVSFLNGVGSSRGSSWVTHRD